VQQALKADLLSQVKSQQTSLLKQAGPRVPTVVLIKDSLTAPTCAASAPSTATRP